jgi:hypothetical protein
MCHPPPFRFDRKEMSSKNGGPNRLGDGREWPVETRGRSCPLAYRYQPEALAEPAQLEAEMLLEVGVGRPRSRAWSAP